MAGSIPQSFIEDLLNRINLTDVIGARIQLKKAGGSYKARCPFHDEKTPSFNVVPEKQFYHCFGCGAHGDAIDFVREFDGLDFSAAIEELARLAGVEVPRSEAARQQAQRAKTLQEAVEWAKHWYRDQYRSHPQRQTAVQYLQERGLSTEIIERFELGYAPAGPDTLFRHCPKELQQQLLQTRIVSDRYNRPYDLFQNRVMFPIRNTRGKTIAFGGRTLIGDKSKYINSPESDVFHKSHEIYGLYEAIKANRQLDKLLIVEGYMDVVALAQFGIDYAVATLGTATNEENLSTLMRHCRNLVFCFDGDAAGFNAAKKAMERCLPMLQDGDQIGFLLLPEGEDPDTLIRQEGKLAFEKRVAEARPLSSFLFDVHKQGLDLKLPEHKGLLRARAEADLNSLAAPTLRAAMRDQLKLLTNNFYRRQQQKENQRDIYYRDHKPAVLQSVKIGDGICIALALYFQPKLAEKFSEIRQWETTANDLGPALRLLGIIEEYGIDTTESLQSFVATQGEIRKKIQGIFDRVEIFPNEETAIQAARDALQKIRNQQQHKTLDILLQKQSITELTPEQKQALKNLSTRRD